MFGKTQTFGLAAILECIVEVNSVHLPSGHLILHNGANRIKREIQNGTLGGLGGPSTSPPEYIEGYKEGPHPKISDSLFSLIIFIYVAITFSYMFYAFCWRSPDSDKPDPNQDHKDLPMITEMLNEVDNQTKEENAV